MEKVQEIIKKYSLTSLEERFNKIKNSKLPIFVGFLGEFSSGKSSLINAILNRKILPALETPTTKNITKILFRNVDDISYYIGDEELNTISPLEFYEYATGKKKGNISIIVPETEVFKDNVCLIDTPGLSSLDKTDEDITFGYLPFLDAAVICIDANFGSLTESILNFLKQDIVKAFIDNIFFAVTHASDKTPQSLEEIKNCITKQLTEMFPSNIDLTQRIFIVDSINILNGDTLKTSENIKKAFLYNIYSKYNLLLKRKLNKEFYNLISDLVEYLENYKNNLKLDEEEFILREKELQKEIEIVNREKDMIENKLQSLKKNLLTIFENLGKRYLSMIKTDMDNMSKISESLLNEIKEITENNINSFFKDSINIKHISPNLEKVVESVSFANNIADISKLLAEISITLFLLPGTGLVKNAVEGAAGAALTRGGKIVSQSFGFLGKIGTLIKAINPVEHVVNIFKPIISSPYIEANLMKEIDKYLDNVISICREQIEYQYFIPIQDRLQSLNQSFYDIKIQKQKARNCYYHNIREIDDDINILKKLRLELEI